MSADEFPYDDLPCRCPRDSWGSVICQERSGPTNTFCVAEREAETEARADIAIADDDGDEY